MDSKTLAIGLVIGLLFGAIAGYAVNLPIQSQVSTLQEQIDQKNSQISTLQSETLTLESQLSEMEQESETLETQITTLQDQISQKEVTITQLQTQISTLQTEKSDLQNQVEQLLQLVPPLPPSEGEPGSSRFFPAPINTEVTVIFTYLGDTFTAKFTVIQIIRGTQAWSMIQAANMFNDPPKEGYEYILAKIKIELLVAPTAETSYTFMSYDFDAVSGTGKVYDNAVIVEPDPQIDVTLYQGSSHEGWCAFEVEQTDDLPVMAFGRHSDGTGGVWFKLTSDSI